MLMVLTFLPLGINHYLLGGIIIGLAVSFIYFTTGIMAGASSFYSSTLSYFSKHSYFQQPLYRKARLWRLIFSIGIILGAIIFLFAFNKGETFVSTVSLWRFALGGFLIGYGTRLSRGCTSGHGICGLASFSKPSLFAVIIFLAVAILTAITIQTLGVAP